MIAGMNLREAWQNPAQPVRGPAPKGTPGTWVIHYPGGGGAPVGSAVAPYLRNIQADYTANRGYSIGYNWGVSQDGSTWEIRGDDFNNAANKGSKWNDQGNSGNFNDVSQAIFVMVAGQDAGTGAAVSSINRIVATHPTWGVIIHGDVDYTSCCGTGLIAQVRDGTIGHHGGVPEPVPPPEVPEEEDIMIAYIAKPPQGNTGPWMVVINGAVRYATNEDTAALSDHRVLNQEQYGWLLRSANLD